MSSGQSGGSNAEAERIVAGLRQIVQSVPPAPFGEDDYNYERLYVESISSWLNACMLFGRELAGLEGIWFESRTPRQPEDMRGFVRYLGVSDAWLGALHLALQSGAGRSAHGSKDGSDREVKQLEQLRKLVDRLEQMISISPTYLRLEGEDDGTEPSSVISWVLVCGNFVVDKLAAQGIRSRMDVPKWGSDIQRSMGALDTWLSMLQEAVDMRLRPVAA